MHRAERIISAPLRCRMALQAGAAPNLAAAGAALAAAFLRQGLAGGDTVVLGRLMALLCSPLKNLQATLPIAAPATFECTWQLQPIEMPSPHSELHLLISVCSAALLTLGWAVQAGSPPEELRFSETVALRPASLFLRCVHTFLPGVQCHVRCLPQAMQLRPEPLQSSPCAYRHTHTAPRSASCAASPSAGRWSPRRTGPCRVSPAPLLLGLP